MEIKYGNMATDGFDYYIKDDLGGVHTVGMSGMKLITPIQILLLLIIYSVECLDNPIK
jgi:hypothetical protein